MVVGELKTLNISDNVLQKLMENTANVIACLFLKFLPVHTCTNFSNFLFTHVPLGHTCQTKGPEAKFNQPSLFMWPFTF